MSSIQYNIEAELSSAKNRLANLQKQQQQNTVESSHSSNSTERLTPAQQLYQRALKAKDDIEYITLNQSLIEFMSSNVASSSNQSDDGTDVEELVKATEMCTSLGLLLIQHSSNHHQHNNSEGRKSTKLYNETLKWYTNLYNTTRTKARTIFAAQLYKLSSEYPSTVQSSTVINEALVSSSSSLNATSGKCLVELQIVYDVITQYTGVVVLPPSLRLDIVDELCKPIANRIKFLFLNEETGIMSSSSSGQQERNVQQQQQSKIERLPEWTFRYLREVIDNHGVLSLVIEDGVQPLIDTVMDTLIQRISLLSTADTVADVDMDDNQHTPTSSTSKAHETIQQLKNQYYSHSATYFLREMSRMARHVIRSKSFFQHPDVVGSECLHRSIVLKAIKQLFLFDTFMEDKLKDIGVGYSGVNMSLLPIRMLDTFLSSNESLFRWWLDEERDGIIATLHECGSSSLSSYQDDEDIFTSTLDIVDKEEGGEDTSSVDRLYPPISELFIALLHSARSKSNMFMSHHSRQMYIAVVIAPACSVYLDLVHAEATHLREQLLARPPTSSSSTSTGVPSVNVLRSTTNLPSDKLLTCNTMEWSALITGTHLASQLLLQPSSSSTDTSDDNNILEKVGVSMQHLCSAMVDDYTSALVETIIMERAKFASYMMRAPFLLSDPLPDLPELPLSGSERRDKRDKDTSNRSKILTLSPDLNDSMHVVSVSIKACNKVKAKVGSMFQVTTDSSNSGEVEQSMMLYHGCQLIHDAIKFAVGQKLLDIALDPQGMTPEIYQSGAMQFECDVKAFNRLFSARQTDQQPGPMERVVTSARLMSLDSPQINSLRETFRSLVDADTPIRNLFGRTVDDSGEMNEPSNSRLDVDDFYKDQRLLDEASNMLEAKGFPELALEEVLSVLNRRL